MKHQLTEHFSLEEMTRSDTATARGLVNDPSVAAISNLQHLCQEVLEPLRQHAGVPLRINSGYRSREVNNAVGGVSNSQHLTGEAADIRIPDVETGLQWIIWINQHCVFDQLLFETNGRSYWIHVSCRRTLNQNRFQVKFVRKKANSAVLGQIQSQENKGRNLGCREGPPLHRTPGHAQNEHTGGRRKKIEV